MSWDTVSACLRYVYIRLLRFAVTEQLDMNTKKIKKCKTYTYVSHVSDRRKTTFNVNVLSQDDVNTTTNSLRRRVVTVLTIE